MTLRVACLALLVAGFALAQNQPLDLSEQGKQEQTGQNRELDDGQTKSQSRKIDDGPSVLSRDSGWTSQRSGKLIGFHFYGEITGIYDSGLTPVTLGTQAKAGNAAAQGVEAGAGVIGSRQWRHEKLSVEYKGTYRQYANTPLFSGTDQFFRAAYSRMVQRHVVLDVKETLGTTTLANSELAYLTVTGANMFAVPANQLFDNRTNYLHSRVDLTWDATARLSFSFGGQGFIVRRESRALAGLSGYGARADIAYRLTRHQTISASYEYASFDFQRTFADAELQIAALGYSIEFRRNWDLSTQAGIVRTGVRGLDQAAIDPAIAAIVGQNTAVVSFSRTLYLPIAEARLIHRLKRSELTFALSSGVAPGNGVYFTSRQTAGTIGYAFTQNRRLALRLNAGFSVLSPLGQALGKYSDWQGGAIATYTLTRGTFFELQYDYRHYTTQYSGFRMDSNRVSLGLAFSPGETPLAFF